MDTSIKQRIEVARGKEIHELTRKEHVLLMLSSGEWVDSFTLCTHGGGTGYRTRISELNYPVRVIESERNPASPKGENWWRYRLSPEVVS